MRLFSSITIKRTQINPKMQNKSKLCNNIRKIQLLLQKFVQIFLYKFHFSVNTKINLSNKSLTYAKILFFLKVFFITPKVVPKLDFISSIEQTTLNLSEEQRDDFRIRSKVIIEKPFKIKKTLSLNVFEKRKNYSNYCSLAHRSISKTLYTFLYINQTERFEL